MRFSWPKALSTFHHSQALVHNSERWIFITDMTKNRLIHTVHNSMDNFVWAECKTENEKWEIKLNTWEHFLMVLCSILIPMPLWMLYASTLNLCTLEWHNNSLTVGFVWNHIQLALYVIPNQSWQFSCKSPETNTFWMWLLRSRSYLCMFVVKMCL